MAMLSLEEAAARLGITADQLRSKAKSGEIRALHDGGKLLFREEEIAKAKPPEVNPLKPDFELDFGSSDSEVIADASPIHSDPSDQVLVPSLDAKHDSSLEFSLIPEDSSDIDSEPSFVLDMPEDVGIQTGTPSKPKKPAPDSSGIIDLKDGDSKSGSSSDFLIDAQSTGRSDSSGDFLAAVAEEIPQGHADDGSSTLFEHAPVEGDLFELADSNPDQTIAYNPPPQDDSSSEFDLELAPGEGLPDEGSGSEFDLTLEPNSGPSDSAVFETDFSSLGGESDSSSEIVAIDGIDSGSDLGASEDGTGSEVVPLDEDVHEGEVTTRGVDNLEVDGIADFAQEDDGGLVPVSIEEGEDAPVQQLATAPAGPEAPWGVMPALVLLPTALILFVVGLVSVEMLRTVWAYNRGLAPTRPVIKALSELIGNKIPD